ncbi:MAG: hypothetical protein ACPGSM_09845 [Thiolinea sp.]
MLLDSRTRPVHRILEPLLPPDALAYALRLWNSEYVHHKHISMLSFVDAFYHRQPLPHSRKYIYRCLLPALKEIFIIRSTFDENNAEPYEFPDYDQPGMVAGYSDANVLTAPEATEVQASPAQPPSFARPESPMKEPAQASAVAPEPQRDEKFLAFSTFVRKLLGSLSAEKRNKVVLLYRKELRQAVPRSIATPFYEWLESDKDYFAHEELDTQSMSNVVHCIYTGLCNYLGPLDADDALMKAAKFIDSNFDKEKLDVRNLL